MHQVIIMTTVYVEELPETNFAEFNKTIQYSIFQSGLYFTLDEGKCAPEQFAVLQTPHVMAATHGVLRKIIPNTIIMELSYHSLIHTPEQIIQDVRSRVTGTNCNIHRRLEM